jgi:hypothetical protein
VNRHRLLLVLVALVAPACTPPSARSSEPPVTAPSEPTVPRSDASTAEAPGPVKAAVRYVASMDSLVAHSAIGRQEILDRLVTAESLAEHADALESAFVDMAATLDVPVERLTWVEAPLTASLVTTTGSSASVDVWTVSILGAPHAGSPQQVWRTVRVDLEHTDQGWLVAAANADAGPTPAANELALQASWAEFETVASWPPVVAGVDL